jgi:hypothetical protein
VCLAGRYDATATVAWGPNDGQHDAVNLPDGFDSRRRVCLDSAGPAAFATAFIFGDCLGEAWTCDNFMRSRASRTLRGVR